MKVVNIVGARPQFIKYFPISKAIKRFNNYSRESIKDILIHTGQHYDYVMSKIFFDEFGIKDPEYHLDVGSSFHGEQTGQIIQRTEEVLLKEEPDVVLIYGDTNSTLGGSLAAAKLHIPVAHVEAGLRSFNKLMPEEINRILTDHISTILLCPSEIAVRNLIKEGFINIINDGKLVDNNFNFSDFIPHISHPIVLNVGDVMYDVLLNAVEIAERQSKILEQLQLIKKDYRLLTLHRAENTDNLERLDEIINFVNDISSNTTVIFPMHPRTKKVYDNSKKNFSNNIKIIEPVGYFDMIMLLKSSKLLMTDSGGMQKEAYWLRVPCITLRDETEWIETVQSGWNILYKNYKGTHNPSDKKETYYGDGAVAKKIVSVVSNI